MFNTLRPFFSEIFIPGEDEKNKASRSRGLTLITLIVGLNIFLFSNKIFVFNPPWSRETIDAGGTTATRVGKDPNSAWLEFLESQLTDHVNEISALEKKLADSEDELSANQELNRQLEQEIQSLKRKINFLKSQIDQGASSRDIYERLKELEERTNGN